MKDKNMNQFELILLAAARARELKQQERRYDYELGQATKNVCVQALEDIEHGRVTWSQLGQNAKNSG